ncbi:MAG: hypothetical protein QXF12_04410 [Candidatus Aenigmatarchaeota archaeon]
MIISLSGPRGSGKSTVATYLVEKYGFVEETFAKPLKDFLSSLFLWDREMMEGKSEEMRKRREEKDSWWSERLNIPDFSPRKAMIMIGTEIMRNHFCENIWILSLERRLASYKNEKNIVITDCRFKNELKFLKSIGAFTIFIEREKSTKEILSHISERDLIDNEFDFRIRNNDTLEYLFYQVDKIMEKLGTVEP